MNTNIATIAGQQTTMTSLEIAELTGKQHKHVMQDIRNMVQVLFPEVTPDDGAELRCPN